MVSLGAYFGTTFPHLFMMTFENMLPPLPNPSEIYIPRIFGFRVSEKSPAGPHMTWLRARFDSTPNEASSDDESMVEEGTATETQDATINKDDQMDVDADGHATNNRTNLAVNTPVQKR
jgi:casein kinase II subunit beta